jgi:hypothetical protein
MPRTKSTKKDNRTPPEKLERVSSKIELLIFFQYYDGYNTGGMVGFDTNAGPPGSAKHRAGIFEAALTMNQFRSKGKKLATLARAFVDNKLIPMPELRPQFDQDEIENMREESKDSRSPIKKLDVVSEVMELFVFFQYYDGYKTGGEIGFNPRSGPPGSINHKRAYARFLPPMSESQFRDKGKSLANLAKEFVDNGILPPENLRPQLPEREAPWGMIEVALNGGY